MPPPLLKKKSQLLKFDQILRTWHTARAIQGIWVPCLTPALEHLHPTPANTPFHLVLQQDSTNSAVDGPFCSGHVNPFKSFVLLWIWTLLTITPPNVKT
jgi:hypothetical protein